MRVFNAKPGPPGHLEVRGQDGAIGQITGEALAAVKGASVVDAMVMVSAALRGDVVYTSD